MRRSKPTIQFTKQPYIEDVGPRRIESIKFSMFSDADILKAAEVEVYRGMYYDQTKKPIEHGLLDARMGPPNKHGFCRTCNGNFQECPGHYGYLNLALPVYNVGYLSTVLDILKCICKQCSRVLLEDKDRQDFLRKTRNPKLEALRKNELFKRVVKKCTAMVASRKAVKCPRCGYVNGVVKKASPFLIAHDRSHCNSALSHLKESKDNNPSLDAKVLHYLLKNMLDEDCELLYLNERPENSL